MRKIGLAVIASLAILSGCDKGKEGESASAASALPGRTDAASAVSASSVATSTTTIPAIPAPPPHNYALNQDGTYGYEPALSEDDIRSGKATKPLVMMRYVGLKNGNHIILIIDEDNTNLTNRVTCQAPCGFARSELMVGNSVVKTETVRVVPNSLIGAMLTDAMSGQLTPYGQQASAAAHYVNVPANASTSASPPMENAAEASSVQASAPGPSSDGVALQQTSFDCGRAKSIPEYLICHDPDLAAADRDLAVVYQRARDAVIDKGAFSERTRKQWNFREKNCRDKECLMSWYAYQKRVLTKIAQTGDVTAQDD
nr:hypothetical protein [Burkholderia multivorans]